MRKLFVNNVILLTLVASVLLVSSCEKKEEIHEADLIGTWDIGQASVDIKVGPISLFDFLISTLQFGQEAAQELVDQYTSEFIEIGGGTIAFNEDVLPPCSKPLIRSFITRSWVSIARALALSVSSSFSRSILLLVRDILVALVGRKLWDKGSAGLIVPALPMPLPRPPLLICCPCFIIVIFFSHDNSLCIPMQYLLLLLVTFFRRDAKHRPSDKP